MSSHAYDDIIHLPHHVSPVRRLMTPLERAAQFAPFAALTGYDDCIREETRLTEAQIIPGDWAQEELNAKLRRLEEAQAAHPALTVTYFVPDPIKQGGRYETKSGILKRIRRAERELILVGEPPIPLDAVLSLEGDIFSGMDAGR